MIDALQTLDEAAETVQAAHDAIEAALTCTSGDTPERAHLRAAWEAVTGCYHAIRDREIALTDALIDREQARIVPPSLVVVTRMVCANTFA